MAGWSGSVVEGCSPPWGLVTTQDVEGRRRRGEAQQEYVSKSSQAPAIGSKCKRSNVKVQERRRSWDSPQGKQVPGFASDQQSREPQWCPQGHMSRAKSPGHPSLSPREEAQSSVGRRSLLEMRGWTHLAEGSRAGAGPVFWTLQDGVTYCQPPVWLNPSPQLQTRTLHGWFWAPPCKQVLPGAGLGLAGAQCQAHPQPWFL